MSAVSLFYEQKEMEERIRSYVEQIKNPYKFKVGDAIVLVSYADTDRILNDNFITMISAM